MIRSSASLMAEDVTVRCRVRRSKTACEPDFGPAQEMTVTMRNWEARHKSFPHQLVKPSSRPDASTLRMVVDDRHHYGPELLLTAAVHYATNRRDDSPVRAYSLPISDILLVETFPDHKLQVTSISYGVFEFHCKNANGHDIMLAFLQASLDKERILNGSQPGISRSASSCSCLDVDAFTAQHVRGHVENESIAEKISRRMGKVVNSLQEMSGSFCDVACCRGPADLRDPPLDDLGLEEERSPRRFHYGKGIMPDLSMESEPEMEFAR